jgi:hypothetical protein
MCQEYTYIDIKIDNSANQNTEINHVITQPHKAINQLNLVWWNKHVTKKLENEYI